MRKFITLGLAFTAYFDSRYETHVAYWRQNVRLDQSQSPLGSRLGSPRIGDCCERLVMKPNFPDGF
jgi:hypothetical protein